MKERTRSILFFCVIACSISLYLGQDSNFDLLNYHIYNAWAVLKGRWSQDFVAAGMHTFFSPVLDIPYYLVATKLFPQHGAFAVALAGVPYGLLLYVVYIISDRFARILHLDATWDRVAFNVAVVLLAGTGAATWSQIGTTTNDIPIAVVVLAGFHQLLCEADDRGDERFSFRRIAIAGGLLGLAMGLKLTAAIYVPAMGAVIFVIAKGWQNKIRSVMVYGCCAFAAFAIAYGPWAWMLHRLTGNPFFPMFNGLFHSDWMANASVRDVRFLPRSALQWLFYPFYWTSLQAGLVTELPFRDVRLALAFVFLGGYAGTMLWSKALRDKLGRGGFAAMNALVLFMVFSYILWMYEFSILRYLVAIECLAGLFIVISLTALMRRLPLGLRWLPAISVIAFAAIIVGFNVNPRWGRVPAGTDIFAVHAPRLEDGALVIFADEPMSFLARGLSPQAQGLRFMTIPRNFANGGILGADVSKYELGQRLRRHVQENNGALYVLFHTSEVPPESSLTAFNVHVDLHSCQVGDSPLGSEFFVCRANRQDETSTAMVTSEKFRLYAKVLDARPGSTLQFSWQENECTDHAVPGQAAIQWVAPEGVSTVNVYVGHTSDTPRLMTQGGMSGNAQTGRWVSAGQRFDLEDGRGERLGSAEIAYERCGA